MKRLLSICFACILLFNLCGYRLLIDFLQHQAGEAMATRINNGVKDSDEQLLSLKIPASLPYYTNSKDFQWTSGEVQLDGTVYRYVKRRIYNDSIEYLCLPDAGKTRLLNARDRFFQLAYDLQSAKVPGGNNTTPVKPLLLEYCDWHTAFTLPAALLAPINHIGYVAAERLPQICPNPPAHPPNSFA